MITQHKVREGEEAAKLCRIGFESYKLQMRSGHRARKKGDIRKGREMHWEAGNTLELTVGWMLGLRARQHSENAWKWAGESQETKGDWDYTNDTTGERVDIKACKASQYGGYIFIEESSKGVPSGWTRDRKDADYLLYVDTDTGGAWLIPTQHLLGVLSRAGRPTSGGDDGGAHGWTIHLATLAQWEAIAAQWEFPVYTDDTSNE